jgi:hypothetical protein
MKTAARPVALAAFVVVLTIGGAAAQQSASTRHQSSTKHHDAKSEAKADSSHSTWGETKDMSRREWNAAKRKWAKEKVKWRDCSQQSDRENLTAPKSWSYVARCMAKS